MTATAIATKTTHYAQVNLRYGGESYGTKVIVRFKRLKGRFLVSVYEGGHLRRYTRLEFQSIEEARQYWRDLISNAIRLGWQKV